MKLFLKVEEKKSKFFDVSNSGGELVRFIVFPIFFWGRKMFLKPMLFIQGVVTFHRGSCLYFL